VVLRVDNLFDEDYIVARRPAGVRPGRDRTAMLGLRMRL
jgi:Fe(3+) dicitrate transport protein